MPGEVPDLRFRLSHTLSVAPDLHTDEGPSRGILIGQNNPAAPLSAVFLGKHAETPHKNVWMDTRGAHVLYVMGKRRSGKSFTLGAIAEALVSQSWIRQGEFSQAVLVLDTMNVFLTMPFSVQETQPEASSQVQLLAKWRIAAETLPLQLYAPIATSVPPELASKPIALRASDLGIDEWCGLFDVDPFVDPMGHLLTMLLSKLAIEGIVRRQTGARIPPRSVYSIADMTEAMEVDTDLNAFAGETRQALKRRLDALAKTPLFGDHGLDVLSLLTPGKVSVLLLRDLDAEMRSVMVSLIVKRLMQLRASAEQYERLVPVYLSQADKLKDSDAQAAEAAKKKADDAIAKASEGAPRTWLIIDEAHNYVPARANAPSKRPLVKYVNEGRNLGLSIVVATQQPSGLDGAIQRNADLLLIHSLSHHDDIVAAQGMINTAVPDEAVIDGKYRMQGPRSFEALVRALPLGYAIASSDRVNRLFPICVRPRTTVHGGADY